MVRTRVNTVLVTSAGSVLALEQIVFERDGRRILDDVTLCVEADQRWVVLGANGLYDVPILRAEQLTKIPVVTSNAVWANRTSVRGFLPWQTMLYPLLTDIWVEQ